MEAAEYLQDRRRPLLGAPRTRAYLGLGLAAIGMIALAASGELRVQYGRFFALYALSIVGYALLLSARGHFDWRVLVIVAIVVRLAFVPVTPSLSGDYHRYIWDGRVQMAGINPYAYPPSATALDGIPFADRENINHPNLKTIYPAASELLFYGIAALGGGMVALKAVLGMLDLLTAAAVAMLAGPARRNAALAFYLVCPIVILATWESAHVEVAGTLFAVLAALMVLRQRDVLAGIALGLATAFKATPIVLLIPALIGRRARWSRLIPSFALAFLAPSVPYLLSGHLGGSLSDTSIEWVGNVALFGMIRHFTSYPVALAIAAVVAVSVAAAVSLRLPGRTQTAAAFTWTAVIGVLVLPSVQPWYWLTPVALAAAVGLWTPLLLGLAAPVGDIFYAFRFVPRPLANVLSFVPALAVGLVADLMGKGKTAAARDVGSGEQDPEAEHRA